MTARAPLAALVVAWAARLYRLDAQSLWYDEGTSVTVAPRDLTTILANAAADIHPPLYYLLLHYWVGAVGTSEWALRLLSAALGVLTVAVVCRLAWDLLGPVGGVAAGLLAALAPLEVWYSQEARMYALAALAGVGATLVLLRALERGGSRLWACYGLLLTVTLYTHYFAATIPVAHAIVVAATWRRRGAVTAWVVATAAGGLLFLPWVARTLGQLTGWPATAPPYGARELVVRALGLLALGQGADRLPLSATWPLALALAIGAAWLLRRGRVAGRWLALAALLVPLAAMLAVSRSRPFFHPKFVLLVAPYAEILLASAVVALGRVRPPLAVAAVLVLVGWRATGTWAQWHEPGLARDDYRGLAAQIAMQEQPGDAVVLNAPGQIELFQHYYRGASALYPLPEQRPPDRAATEAKLAQLAARHERVWLVLWATTESDPEGIVERWLGGEMYETGGRWWGGVRSALYLNPRLADLGSERRDVDARLGGFAELRAVDLLPLDARAGQAVPLMLEWGVVGRTDRRYTVFVHLIDDDEYLWGQRDAEPAAGARPTDTWSPGETIVDRVGLPILPGTPPGSYRLEIGMYRPDNGERLPITDALGRALGDRVLVGPIEVGPARTEATPPVGQTVDADFGGARLLGYDLHPLGRDAAPPEVAPGEPVLLTLHWRADPSVRTDLGPARLLIEGRARSLVVGRGRHPPERWAPNEYVRDPHRVDTAGLTPGRHPIEIDVAGRRIDIGAIVVR
jgi:mannosyltransferase